MSCRRLWAAGLLVAAAVAPARAGTPDPYLPADTEVVVTLNVRQLLDSALLKKVGVGKFKEAVQSAEEVKEVLDALGFDPFADLDRITVAGPGGNEPDRGLVIARGKFDPAKFRARAEQAANDNPEVLKKIHKVGPHAVFEVVPPEQETSLFVAVPARNVLFASPGKDYVADALKKVPAAEEGPALKHKDMRTLLQRMDDKQSLAIAAVGSALEKAAVPDAARDLLGKLDAVGGGLTVTDEVKLELVFTTKTAEQARDIEKTVAEGLNQALGLLALVGGQKPELTPLLDFVKSLKTTRKDRMVTLRGHIGAEVFDRLQDKDK